MVETVWYHFTRVKNGSYSIFAGCIPLEVLLTMEMHFNERPIADSRNSQS